jgi:hypothetical protein
MPGRRFRGPPHQDGDDGGRDHGPESGGDEPAAHAAAPVPTVVTEFHGFLTVCRATPADSPPWRALALPSCERR